MMAGMLFGGTVSVKGITTYQNGLGIDDKLRSKNRRTVRYFLTDHLGSTEALANASGAIVSSTSYDSFGNATSNIQTSYRYTGREYDADTGLYYYRNRWYDPEIGRFISKDPIGFAGGDINLYGYVGNNPLSFIDTFGKYACESRGGYPGRNGEEDDDEVIDGGTTSCPSDLSIVTALCPGQPEKTRTQMFLGGFRDKLKKPIIKVPGLSIDRLWIVNNIFTPAVSLGGIPFLGAGNTIKTRGIKFGLDVATHPFPIIGKWSHIQVTTFINGVPGTHKILLRLPLPTKEFVKKNLGWMIKKGQNLSLRGRK